MMMIMIMIIIIIAYSTETAVFWLPSMFMPASRHLRSRQARHWLRCILSIAHVSGLSR